MIQQVTDITIYTIGQHVIYPLFNFMKHSNHFIQTFINTMSFGSIY